jgi:hypothetical protein
MVDVEDKLFGVHVAKAQIAAKITSDRAGYLWNDTGHPPLSL